MARNYGTQQAPQKASSRADMSVREAGRKGGQTTSQEVRSGELPRDFYQQIGHKGGQKVRELIERGKQATGED